MNSQIFKTNPFVSFRKIDLTPEVSLFGTSATLFRFKVGMSNMEHWHFYQSLSGSHF